MDGDSEGSISVSASGVPDFFDEFVFQNAEELSIPSFDVGPAPGILEPNNTCIGTARVIGAEKVADPPSNGAFPSTPVTGGTAAIDLLQFYPDMAMGQAMAVDSQNAVRNDIKQTPVRRKSNSFV